MPASQPDVSTLRRLRPLTRFDDDQLQALANQLQIHKARKKEKLIKRGCMEQFNLFILNGSVSLIAGDGKTKEIAADSDDALNPIAQLRPCMYDVVARKPLQYLKIDAQLLTEFAQHSEQGDDDISVRMIENSPISAVTVQLYRDLYSDTISLPSLPEVAQRIQRVFQDPDLDADKVVQILISDPAMSGKLIKVANSAAYQGTADIDTLQGAVVRLGMKTTYSLVMAYALNDLFSAKSTIISTRMRELAKHCRKVAALSRLLAKHVGGFDPDQALLAGLTHDLGVIAILDYLESHLDEISSTDELEETIQALRPQICGMLMRKCNFTEELVKTAEECADWFRNPADEPDLCDLVMIAQYHALMGTEYMKQLPPLTKLPAMSKLGLEPAASIELIKQSRAEIAEIEGMLG